MFGRWIASHEASPAGTLPRFVFVGSRKRPQFGVRSVMPTRAPHRTKQRHTEKLNKLRRPHAILLGHRFVELHCSLPRFSPVAQDPRSLEEYVNRMSGDHPFRQRFRLESEDFYVSTVECVEKAVKGCYLIYEAPSSKGRS